MKKVVILKWDSIVLGFTSIIYGLTLFINGDILTKYDLYRIIDEFFSHHVIGVIFIGLGLLKIIGVWKNILFLKKLALIGLVGFWSMFSVSFMLTPPTNTVWIFSLAMAMLGIGIALKGD